MRIKLLISVGGTTYSHVPGDIVDWPDEAAHAYIAEGYAEPIVDTPQPSEPPPARASRGGRAR